MTEKFNGILEGHVFDRLVSELVAKYPINEDNQQEWYKFMASCRTTMNLLSAKYKIAASSAILELLRELSESNSEKGSEDGEGATGRL